MRFLYLAMVCLYNLVFVAPNSTDSDLVMDCKLIQLAKQLINTFCHLDPDNSTPDDQWHVREIVSISWTLVADRLNKRSDPLTSLVRSSFDDVEELTSLLVGTRGKFKRTDNVIDLVFLEKLISTQSVNVISLLEHDLLAQIFSVQPPQTVPLSNELFHFNLLSVITLLLESPFKNENSKDQTRAASLCVERVANVAKSYLVFILPKADYLELDQKNQLLLSKTITKLHLKLIDLEQSEARRGRQLITEREMWEVAGLTETEQDETLDLRVKGMNRRDGKMRKKETDRWMLRRRRLGECGFEDALEARTTTRKNMEADDVFFPIYAIEKKEGMNFDIVDEEVDYSDSSDDLLDL
ncbi:hypothetical protein BLNAU_4295 [Blattamonas nauphoetae]|uniref:Uncharacterized protein n=1 Tax=Blattamonas nauphoetae TaxID=2049346 RepID=A0ABQ9YA59_9EUKA|nr:hypothetical protein BLNAU_4295 [Blattamonas nauphoetae]